jgi:alkyl sulfatase BDS1-like metallo-beta-lactamase superfamily hydrolase
LCFYNVPGAECPAEMTFSIPDKKLYDGAENMSQQMHNLLPVRGAKVRDALRWSNYMDEALEQTREPRSTLPPTTGRSGAMPVSRTHYPAPRRLQIHPRPDRAPDQRGQHPREIADLVKLPKSLSESFGARGYYGDLRHNVKAVYQFYLGAYDGNPANLDALPPQESAKRYLNLIGGSDKAVAAAQTAFDKGEYRWAAELLNQAVFGDPKSTAAKELLAKTYEQMGYMSEAATWRNSYLTAAQELRNGPPTKGVSKASIDANAVANPHGALSGSHGCGSERPGCRGQKPQDQPGADRPERVVCAVD